MLSYPQISQQLMPYVEKYNNENPGNTALQEVVSNIHIYQTPGVFVLILEVLIGSRKCEESNKFDMLCSQYRLTKLKDIPPEDANALWDEFRRLLSKATH